MKTVNTSKDQNERSRLHDEFMSKPQKKNFLCKEDGEKFIIKADSLLQAKQYASMYNAVVLYEQK